MKLNYTEFNHIPYESHMLMYDQIHPGSSVLDVGCATGAVAERLKKIGCTVVGLELDPEAVKIAKKHCEKVYRVDLEKLNTLPFNKNFDYILFMDLIEHLRNPENIIRIVRKYLNRNGKIVFSIPNIAFIGVRKSLLFGNFDYQDTGLLDRTHVRLYTKKSAFELLYGCDLNVESCTAISNFIRIPFFGKYLNHIPKNIQHSITQRFDTLLGYQFLFVCTNGR